MPNKMIRCTPVSFTVGFYLGSGSESARLDMDQPYQRGVVWGEARKRALILSLITGVPYGALVINKRLGAGFEHPGYSQERNWMYAVIDGKQRITAIREFAAGKFAIPAEWAGIDSGEDVRFDQLPKGWQRSFCDMTLVAAQAQVATLDEEKELFERVNFGGLAQGESDVG